MEIRSLSGGPTRARGCIGERLDGSPCRAIALLGHGRCRHHLQPRPPVEPTAPSTPCAGRRLDGLPCHALTRSAEGLCRHHSGNRERSTPRRSSGVRGWLATPARELLGMTRADLARELGVAEETYASWEADEEPVPQRKFMRLFRLMVARSCHAEYVRTVYQPLFEHRYGPLERSIEVN